MATVLDSIALELGWDTSKFKQGAKETSETTRVAREDFERHAKIFEAAMGSLLGVASKLAAAFLSIEAAIKAIDWTKGASQAGVQFSAVAANIGMAVDKLAEWNQAIEKVTGVPDAASQAFSFQQAELQKRHGPSGEPPSFLNRARQLGLGDLEQYHDVAKGVYDLDRLNRDLNAAMIRQKKSSAERAQILSEFGFNPAASQFFTSDMGSRLAAEVGKTITKANEDTFKRLQEQWSALSNAAAQVGRDLTTWLEMPLKLILGTLTEIAKKVHELGPTSLWENINKQAGSESFWQFWFSPHVADEHGRSHAVPFSEWWSGNIKTKPASRKLTWPEWLGFSPAPPASAPTPSAPPPATFQERFQGVPPPPATFQERFQGAPMMPAVPGPGSGLEQMLNLPSLAMAGNLQGGGSTTNTNVKSQLSIGAVAINSRASDTAMGRAPGDVSKDISVNQYAVHANTALL